MKKWHGIWMTWLLLATMACVGGKGTGVMQVDLPGDEAAASRARWFPNPTGLCGVTS